MDIKNLLDLLNASEEDAAPSATIALADPGAPGSLVPDDVGNRFAAHIVHGMSKRKAQ
jgi:hypothetical protein